MSPRAWSLKLQNVSPVSAGGASRLAALRNELSPSASKRSQWMDSLGSGWRETESRVGPPAQAERGAFAGADRWQWASDVPGSKHRQQSQAQAVPTASAGKACSLHTLTPSLALGRPGTQIHSRAALLRTDYGETQDISPCPQPAACRPLPPTPVLSPPLPRGCSPGKLNPQWPNTAATFDQSLHVPHYIWAEGERNLIDIAELGGYGC